MLDKTLTSERQHYFLLGQLYHQKHPNTASTSNPFAANTDIAGIQINIAIRAT